jgi:hypothetical protein
MMTAASESRIAVHARGPVSALVLDALEHGRPTAPLDSELSTAATAALDEAPTWASTKICSCPCSCCTRSPTGPSTASIRLRVPP